MRNLRKFNSEADYNAAELNYPAVSWVTGTDAVHFDKTAPATNDKVMFAFSTLSTDQPGKDIILWNGGASVPPEDIFTDLTVNDVDVMSDVDASGVLSGYTQPSTLYVTKYGLIDDSTISDIFAANLGGGWGSYPRGIDFFVPSSVSSIEALPENTEALVIDNDTVPTISLNWSTYGNLQSIYVPDNAVSAYQTALDGIWAGTILPMSQYSGNLPL
jgi:hypothetical protein